MLGTKIRSWMEAHIVRPRKKQHRNNKDTVNKKRYENGSCATSKDVTEQPTRSNLSVPANVDVDRIQVANQIQSGTTTLNKPDQAVAMRGLDRGRHHNNNNNLSSPESAYSTGYSTDGTSPGPSFPAAPAPPEYYINIRTGTRYFHSSSTEAPVQLVLPDLSLPIEQKPADPVTTSALNNNITSPALNSPRQRTRIRTNPWVPSTTGSGCNCSPIHSRLIPISVNNNVGAIRSSMCHTINTSSPVRRKWMCNDKKQHCSRFSSSSSSSSSSVSSVHAARIQARASSEDEDDRTLNEMMGKYDESYVYEKETDILSDSDPTDCDEDYDDTDAEAGREGGDERDLLDDDDDFDFIDTGSLELNVSEDGMVLNKGHCTYHIFQGDPGRAVSSRRESSRVSSRRAAGGIPMNLRYRRPSERRARHASSKKRRERYPGLESAPFAEQFNKLQSQTKSRHFAGHIDGSRSAGATPVCVRRRRALAEQQIPNRFEKRCNSVSYNGPALRRLGRPRPVDTETVMYEKDKEADKKYRELIIEAEHILMTMKTNSPPVVGSPRRVALGPANKRVELLRNAECGNAELLKAPSGEPTGVLKVKFSPKRNHITNFINNNSPVMARRDLDTTKETRKESESPLLPRKERFPEARAPLVTFRSVDVVHTTQHSHCPQSEPVKRKVYACASFNTEAVHDMLNGGEPTDMGHRIEEANDGSVFQQQRLFQTITSLKRNLETQSEALRHSRCYGSSQRLTLVDQR